MFLLPTKQKTPLTSFAVVSNIRFSSGKDSKKKIIFHGSSQEKKNLIFHRTKTLIYDDGKILYKIFRSERSVSLVY